MILRRFRASREATKVKDNLQSLKFSFSPHPARSFHLVRAGIHDELLKVASFFERCTDGELQEMRKLHSLHVTRR